jgi:hypothetical protein
MQNKTGSFLMTLFYSVEILIVLIHVSMLGNTATTAIVAEYGS